jgi:hypothetical protein
MYTTLLVYNIILLVTKNPSQGFYSFLKGGVKFINIVSIEETEITKKTKKAENEVC